jgi:hypothetical protein
MASFLRIVILNFHRSISGITGLPVKIPKKMVFEFFLGCWMQKSVWEYLALLKNGMGTHFFPKKSYLRGFSTLIFEH